MTTAARASLGLAAVQSFDYLVQLALPLLLVRQLGADGFATYRTWWLVALTATALGSLNLPNNLVYWIAQQPARRHGALFGNVLTYLCTAGVLGALVIAGLSHAGPHAVGSEDWTLFLAAFCATWLVSQPFDHIGLALGRPALQVRLLLAQTFVRVALIGGAALWAGLAGVSWALLALAVARALAWVACARAQPGVGRFSTDPSLARMQAGYALAFGLGATLFALRAHADGWIAAARFGPQGVANVAIAASIVPVIGLVRQAVIGTSVSRLARLAAQGQLAQALALNRRANLATALCVFPAVATFVAVAEPLIAWLYTPAYASAAGLARGYAALLLLLAFEASPLVQALGHGRFVLGAGAALLALGVAGSVLGSALWGLAGIALGAAAASLGGVVANLLWLRWRHGVRLPDLLPLSLLLQLAIAATCGAFGGALVVDWGSRPDAAGAALSRPLLVFWGSVTALVLYLAAVRASGTLRSGYADAWRAVRAAP